MCQQTTDMAFVVVPQQQRRKGTGKWGSWIINTRPIVSARQNRSCREGSAVERAGRLLQVAHI